MLKHRESHALRLVPVRSSEAEDTQLLELVHGGRLSKAALRQMLRQVDLKKVGLAAGGAAAALSLLHWAHQYRFYHSVIAKELKKQLAPLNKKLDELQAENERLRTELAAQKEHRP